MVLLLRKLSQHPSSSARQTTMQTIQKIDGTIPNASVTHTQCISSHKQHSTKNDPNNGQHTHKQITDKQSSTRQKKKKGKERKTEDKEEKNNNNVEGSGEGLFVCLCFSVFLSFCCLSWVHTRFAWCMSKWFCLWRVGGVGVVLSLVCVRLWSVCPHGVSYNSLVFS